MNNWQGKTIMIVGGGLLQVPAVEIAHDLGLKVVVTDRDPNCACAKIADAFENIDTTDIQEHLCLAGDIDNLAGVFTEGASVERTVAKVAHAMGLPGIPPVFANRISDKYLMRQHLGAFNIGQPKFKTFVSWDELKRAANFVGVYIGFPLIVKPVNSSGSKGVTKCFTEADLTQDVFDEALKYSDGLVLVEQLLKPHPDEPIHELSCETVWYNGQGYWLSAVDRIFRDDGKYAIETQVNAPTMHSPQVMQSVIDLCLRAGKALGMTTGIFKCDVFLSDAGPMILETTARLSGGFDSQYLTPLAYGADYIRGAMLLALGEPIHWEYFHPKWHRAAVANWVFFGPGTVRSIDFRDAEKHGKVFSRVKVGDTIGEYRNCTDRSVVCVVDGRTLDDAARNAGKCHNQVLASVEIA